MLAVLISEPNAGTSHTYLPYVWGLLKTSAEEEPRLAGNVRFLEPIYVRGDAGLLLSAYDVTELDVVGLSCYTWNFDLQCEIAEQVKRINPDCVVIAGGPHPQVKDPDFFRKHPYIDAVAIKDGEATFNDILLTLCQGSRDFSGVKGLYIPTGADRDSVHTGAPLVMRDFGQSPYVAQSDYYQRIMAESPNQPFMAIWETTRGCPYSCSYCDWGSSTMSKIRQFPIERVRAEIDWLTASDLAGMMNADANFGILPRDVDIARYFADATVTHAYHGYFYFSPAKNNPERSLAISKMFIENRVHFQPSLAIQHTDPQVLETVDRKNISAQKQYAVAKELMAMGASIDVQLIIGIPGDSLDRWKACLSQLAEWGLHDDYSIFFFNFLPNAPAADAAYRDFWEIKTIKRVVRDNSGNLDFYKGDGIVQELIVGSKIFSVDDWVEMNIYTSIFRALHCGGLTRFAAIALRSSYGVRFDAFYDPVIDEYVGKIYKNGAIPAFIHDAYRELLANENVLADQTVVAELGGDDVTLSITHAALVRIAMDADAFFAGLEAFLSQRFASVDADMLASLMAFQRAMLVLPDYDPSVGRRFGLRHNWPAYFAGVSRTDFASDLDLPEPLTGKQLITTERRWQTTVFPREARWIGHEGAARWLEWSKFAMENGQKIRNILHQDFQIVDAEPATKPRPSALTRQFGRLREWLAA